MNTVLHVADGVALVDVSTKKHPNAATRVDVADLPLMLDGGPRWFAVKTVPNTLYVSRNVGRFPFRRTERLHRRILGLTDGEIHDHKDRNGLNNTRRNLRPATRSQNGLNRVNFGRSSTFMGVDWCEAAGKWRARAKRDGISRYIGVYDSEHEAAAARDAAVRGDPYVVLNFPDG